MRTVKTIAVAWTLLALLGVTPAAADTAYVSLRGRELHVTLGGTISKLPSYGSSLAAQAALLARFASTAFARDQVEISKGWSSSDPAVADTQLFLQVHTLDAVRPEQISYSAKGLSLSATEAAAQVHQGQPVDFRIQGVTALIVSPGSYLTKDLPHAVPVQPGTTFTTLVPARPEQIHQEVGLDCAAFHNEIDAASAYWYVWFPNKYECSAQAAALAPFTVTVDEVLAHTPQSYPEYDQLLAPTSVHGANEVTVGVMFGQLDHGQGDIQQDSNWQHADALCSWLSSKLFDEQTQVERDQVTGRQRYLLDGNELSYGYRRFARNSQGISVIVHVYYPDYVDGLSYASERFQSVVRQNRVVIYEGHSNLGRAKAFDETIYPEFYQIIYIASCLSYGYYVPPVLRGKAVSGADPFARVDVLSNAVEGKFPMNSLMISSMLEGLLQGLADPYHQVSWQDILQSTYRKNQLGRAVVGVSGARDNAFVPAPPALLHFSSTEEVEILDAAMDPVTLASLPRPVLSGPIVVESDALIHSLRVQVEVDHHDPEQLSYELIRIDADSGAASVSLPLTPGDGALHTTVFNGKPLRGTWQLRVADQESEIWWNGQPVNGTLRGWTLSALPLSAGKADGHLRPASASQAQVGCALGGSTRPGPLCLLLSLGLALALLRRRARQR